MNSHGRSARLAPGAFPTDQVKLYSQNRWAAILRDVGRISSDYLTGRHGPCPVCGGKDRFRFDDKDGLGTWICNQCGAGDGFRLLQLCTGMSFSKVLNNVSQYLGIASGGASRPAEELPRSQPGKADASKQRNSERTWDESIPIAQGDPVHIYLTEERGLRLIQPPNDLRYHRSLPYWEDGQDLGKWPAMVARISSPANAIVNIHRTYLTPDGKKAFGKKSKKLMPVSAAGAMKGAAIRLYPAGEMLGLAEGIETAIACQLSTGIPTWAAISAGLLSQVVVPESVRCIVLFADRDANGKGQTAAEDAAARFISKGLRVKLLLPPASGEDWLDVYLKDLR